jgi:hypothetical protein
MQILSFYISKFDNMKKTKIFHKFSLPFLVEWVIKTIYYNLP